MPEAGEEPTSFFKKIISIRKQRPSQPEQKAPLSLQEITTYQDQLLEALKQRTYPSIVGQDVDTVRIIDRVVEELEKEGVEVIRISTARLREEKQNSPIEVADIFPYLQNHQPEGMSWQIKNMAGPSQNLTEFCQAVAEESEKKLVVVLENIEEITGAASLLAALRGQLHGGENAIPTTKLQWVIAGRQSPKDICKNADTRSWDINPVIELKPLKR